MGEESDYLFALEMQKRLNAECDQTDNDSDIQETNSFLLSKQIRVSKYDDNFDDDYLNRTQNLVHPQWETLDPTPDIFAMFGRFDQKFFQSRLKCVTLEWSKRMYSCAGICYQRRNRFGMDVTIRLSEPLLKLRPRKDLVETMLHEMIHAYCFVLNIREGNGGHGPNFKKIMYAINKVAGTNITVYHTFHDEVNTYKQHWWRCNGICQDRGPFFGYVKRTNNRAPGPNDQWWEQHLHSCGGVFMKVKEPEKPLKTEKIIKTKNKERKSDSSAVIDLRNFIKSSSNPRISSHPFIVGNIGTVNPRNNNVKKSMPSGYMSNVIGLRDLNDSDEGPAAQASSPLNTMKGPGYTMGRGSSNTNRSPDRNVDRNHLRSVWGQTFCDSKRKPDLTRKEIETNNTETKRKRISFDDNTKGNSKSTAATPDNENENTIETIDGDDDVVIIPDKAEIIELSDSDDEDFKAPAPVIKKKPMTNEERQKVIKREILEETIGLRNEDILLIDDEYDDSQTAILAATELADTSLIDEFFGEDTMMQEFESENDLVASSSSYHKDPNNDIISCPVCMYKMKRSVLEDHLNGCMGIVIKVPPPKVLPRNIRAVKPRSTKPSRRTAKNILRNAGYSESDLTGFNSSSSDEVDSSLNLDMNSLQAEVTSSPKSIETNISGTTCQCPYCRKEIAENNFREHLEKCFTS